MPVYQVSYQSPHRRPFIDEYLDGDVLAIEVADKTPDLNRLDLSPGHAPFVGRPVSPEHVPTRLLKGGGMKVATDYCTNLVLAYVSPTMKELIEKLEPEVHQFLPLVMVDRRKEPVGQHWIWIVCNRLDSVDAEHTTFVLHNGAWRPTSHLKPQEMPAGWDLLQPSKLVFNEGQIGNAHFWRDMFLPRHLYCSDEARCAMGDADLTGIAISERESV